jgi:hypothetical protein
MMLSKILAPSSWVDRFLSRPSLPEQVCTSCGFAGVPVRKKKGHDELEVLLWILFTGSAVLYAVSLFAHHASHYHFPGLIVRFFSLFAKLFLTFSVIYTIWQLSSESPVCPKCQRESMIPPDSPKAQEIKRKHQE